jgi:hypothetical protein
MLGFHLNPRESVPIHCHGPLTLLPPTLSNKSRQAPSSDRIRFSGSIVQIHSYELIVSLHTITYTQPGPSVLSELRPARRISSTERIFDAMTELSGRVGIGQRMMSTSFLYHLLVSTSQLYYSPAVQHVSNRSILIPDPLCHNVDWLTRLEIQANHVSFVGLFLHCYDCVLNIEAAV